MEPCLILEQAVQSSLTRGAERPAPPLVVAALLAAEKQARKQGQSASFEQLIGVWRLCFVTGTRKAQQRAGRILGTGRYLPGWSNLALAYTPVSAPTMAEAEGWAAGQVENRVQLGGFHLILRGPTKFLTPKNILAFDFTRLQVQVLGRTLYTSYIRGGRTSETHFYAERVGKQAFFAYFLIGELLIAARGKGGGLALWGRVNSPDASDLPPTVD